jgi:hypothetical protein
MQTKGFTYDDALELKAAGAVTSSAAGSLILDLGAGRTDGRTILDVTAFDATTGDERSQITMQFSNSATFASGVVNGTSVGFGAFEVLGGSADPALGRHELPWCNEIAGTQYRYARIYTFGGGTSPSVTYSAFAVLQAAN